MAKQQGVFRPTYTEAGPDGSRVRRTAATWAYRFEHAGTKYTRSGFATAGDARTARDQRRAEVAAGHERDWRKLQLDAVREMAFARRVSWSPSTVRNFGSAWTRLYRFFRPDELAASIDDTRLHEYVAFALGAGGRRNTARLDLAMLHAGLSIAHRKRLLPWMPEFPVVKYERREQTVAPVQLAQILDALPDMWRLYYEAADELGWRARSEIRSRRWTDVEWGPERWTCETCAGPALTSDACACGAGRPGWLYLDAEATKSRRPRRYPMTRRLRGILQRARVRVDRVQLRTGAIVPWVFCADSGRRLPDPGEPWRRALRKLGVVPLRDDGRAWSSALVPHDVRRTTIRRMRSDGIDRDVRKDLVGHASDSAHAVYESVDGDPAALRAAARLLDQRRLDGVEQGIDERVVQLSLFRSRR